MSELPYALIGAGPMGLACAKVLREQGIAFVGFELHSDVGGLWDIEGPKSTMYQSAHLISSKTKTEFADFPMREEVADYPAHHVLRDYFRDFAENFDLRRSYLFEAEVLRCEPLEEGWQVTWRSEGVEHMAHYAGVIIANGTLSEPSMPEFSGDFAGEVIHSARYRHPDQMRGKRVLVVGGGNSACDIVVDAAHHAECADLSMRRGYHFVPKYIFGKPADTVGGKVQLPMWLKRWVDAKILRWFVGDPQRLGFPEPDHKLYESHPVVNSMAIFHAGHGDIAVRPDIDRFDGKTVMFKDGSQAEYDLVIAATGYLLHYPFIDPELLNWQGAAPHLFLNCMHPQRDDLFVMGMVEATGLGWQGRHEQADLVARYIKELRNGHPAAAAIKAEKAAGFERVTGGMSYVDLPRMAYYVERGAYRKAVTQRIKALGG